MQFFPLDHLSILHLCDLFSAEMPYMFLKLCKSGHFHHIIWEMRKSLLLSINTSILISETDSSISAFGHFHCCQKRYSCKLITEWQIVKIPIRIRILLVIRLMTLIHKDLWYEKFVPSSHHTGKPSHTILCTFSIGNNRIRKGIPTLLMSVLVEGF